MVQWLRLCASNTGGMGLTASQITNIPHAAWSSQKLFLKRINVFVGENTLLTAENLGLQGLWSL